MKDTNKKWLNALLVLLLLGTLLLFPNTAAACSCLQQLPSRAIADLENASAVFSGEVTAVSRPYENPVLLRLHRPIRYLYPDFRLYETSVSLNVNQSWKGVSSSQVTIFTGSGYGDCGSPFQSGESYLIYAYEKEDELYTNICTRTQRLSVATHDLAELSSLPTIPLKPTPPSYWTPALAVLGGLIFTYAGWRYGRTK